LKDLTVSILNFLTPVSTVQSYKLLIRITTEKMLISHHFQGFGFFVFPSEAELFRRQPPQPKDAVWNNRIQDGGQQPLHTRNKSGAEKSLFRRPPLPNHQINRKPAFVD
jgi:hypothetical protein